MFTEPLFFVILLVGIVSAALYLLSREFRKELVRSEADSREATALLLHRMELTIVAQNQKLTDHAEFKLDSTADRLEKALDVLRSAIEHQARQQERLVDQLDSIEAILAEGIPSARAIESAS